MTADLFVETARRVHAATSPDDLFDADPGAAGRTYRRLAQVLHPDRVDAKWRDAATRAFARLAELWRERMAGVTIRTRRGAYRLGAVAFVGDLANLYDVGHGYLKLPRSPGNNDLLEREALALTLLAERGDSRHLAYVPQLVDSFRHRDTRTEAERHTNVVAAADGLRSLAEVRSAYPDGVDPRDAAWMWRRLLVALGFAHRAGVLHGAVLPEHVLIQPAQHGLVLVDWCYAAIGPGDRIPAVVAARQDWYPAEVTRGDHPGPGTDLAMAARCMTYLMGGRAPKALRDFATGCAQPALRNRPDDGWRLLHELDGVLERLYGHRRFRPFSL